MSCIRSLTYILNPKNMSFCSCFAYTTHVSVLRNAIEKHIHHPATTYCIIHSFYEFFVFLYSSKYLCLPLFALTSKSICFLGRNLQWSWALERWLSSVCLFSSFNWFYFGLYGKLIDFLIDWLTDWLISWGFTLYQQYFSHMTAATIKVS